MPQRSWIVAAGGLAALFAAHHLPVDGHIYIVESRQYYNTAVYQDEDFPNLETYAGAYNAGGQVEVQNRARRLTDPDLLAEYGDGYYPLRWVYDKGEMAPNGNYLEPQGISVRHGVCGDPKSGDQGGKDGENTYSTPNKDWPILQEFTQGQVMEIKAVMKAWHYGHLEFFICDTSDLDDPDGVATQECFNKYPLTRAEGDGVNSPIDPNFPGRYYADPPCRENETDQEYDWRAGGGYVMTMNYQLPEGLVCDHCVLQMWYFTGHKCYHPGYEEFNPPSWGSECAPNKSDWIDLSIDYCGDNEWNLAEEFWSCSDITILADGSTPAATPTTPSPEAPVETAEPTTAVTPAPVASTTEPVAPTPAPVAAPTSKPVASTPAPVDVETAEPTMASAPESATAAPIGDGGGDAGDEPVFLGCFHDSKDDRVLGDVLRSSSMTWALCLDYCTDLGAAFMATQFGFECWCSADDDLDYERHYELVGEDAVCDAVCTGDETELCGGFHTFDLYKLPAGCSGSPVEAYEQCGGLDWTGSTCCADGHECTKMGKGDCYSQCRPVITDETTPSPTSSEENTPSPATEEPTTPPPVTTEPPVAPTPGPTESAPTPAPKSPDPVPSTPAPVAPVATPPGSPAAPADMVDMLDLHNEARCIHNAAPLTWSDDVEASALVHAKKMSAVCGDLFHSSREERFGYGENIYYCSGSDSCYTAERAMEGFYEEEIVDKKNGNPYDSVVDYEGHATQILWKSTEQLGCAISECTTSGGSPRTYLACQYNPPGNNYDNLEDEVELPTNLGSC